ncbi:MAG: AmpG family muropeptide MFS transporter [Desulfobacteraceae bacterium]|nr:AmpG family muropeptide MFS transporter [Desulfobacteraceae bacterium]
MSKIKSIKKTLFSRRMLVALIMGYAAGLPLELTGFVLKAWMREEGINLSIIGLSALVGLPYTLKFIQAPILDRYKIPVLGRRRGWLLIFQISLIAAIILLSFANPGQSPLWFVFAAFLVTLFSASQDIVIDAYRREDLSDEELGLGSSMYIAGYRTGMLMAAGGGLIMADHMSFSLVYILLAACMTPAVITTVLTPEPAAPYGVPQTLGEAVSKPFVEFFNRTGALWILAFILLYKIGDTMASSMTAPFYIDLNFTKTEIGTLVKLVGFWPILLGTFTGGILMIKLGINRSLWIFGILQAVSTAGFAVLNHIGHNLIALAVVIGFENLTAGMGTAAYSAFMASISHKKFTATQYALLTSLMGVPRVILSSSTGFMAEFMGWNVFFIFCTLLAIPGMLLLLKFAPWRSASNKVDSQ